AHGIVRSAVRPDCGRRGLPLRLRCRAARREVPGRAAANRVGCHEPRAKLMATTLKLTADCQIQAAADKPARVDMLAYTGSPMRLPGLGTTLVDLSGMTLGSIPLLADHDNRLGSIAGSGEPEIRDGSLHVSGTLATGTAAANQILALHKSGVKLQASIGAE